MLGRLSLRFYKRRPGTPDERVGRLDAAVEEKRAHQRLDHVADDIVAAVCAILPGLLAELDPFRKVEAASDLGASLPRDQDVVTPRQFAFRFLVESLVEPAPDHQPDDAIAEELEPLVTVLADARMGERPLEQRQILRIMTERLAQEAT